MQDLQDKTIRELAKDCHSVEDVHEMLKNLFKDTLQQIFEAEIEEHLGYKKHSIEGNNTGNSRNGYYQKTIQTKFGKSEIEVPRDRNGEFEPRIIGKYENYPSENKILSRMLRKWLLNRFVILSIHSLPFNAFFKAAANIKTSILHLRKKFVQKNLRGISLCLLLIMLVTIIHLKIRRIGIILMKFLPHI